MDDETVEDIRCPLSSKEDSLFADGDASDEETLTDPPAEREFRNSTVIFGSEPSFYPLEELDVLEAPVIERISRKDILHEHCNNV